VVGSLSGGMVFLPRSRGSFMPRGFFFLRDVVTFFPCVLASLWFMIVRGFKAEASVFLRCAMSDERDNMVMTLWLSISYF